MVLLFYFLRFFIIESRGRGLDYFDLLVRVFFRICGENNLK